MGKSPQTIYLIEFFEGFEEVMEWGDLACFGYQVINRSNRQNSLAIIAKCGEMVTGLCLKTPDFARLLGQEFGLLSHVTLVCN